MTFLPHLFAAVAQIILPGIAGAVGQAVPAASQMVCATVVAQQSVTNATQFGCDITVGAASQFFACMLYPDSDAGLLLAGTGNAVAGVSAGVLVSSNATFSVVAGTRYRVCVCATSTTVQYLSVRQSGTSTGDLPGALNGATFPTTVGLGATCGSLPTIPTTTGTLTASVAFKIPLVLVSQ